MILEIKQRRLELPNWLKNFAFPSENQVNWRDAPMNTFGTPKSAKDIENNDFSYKFIGSDM